MTAPTAPGAPGGPAVPFPASQCHGCAHLRLQPSPRGSTFLRCVEPSRPRYPPQPVRGCPVFSPAPPAPTPAD